MQFNRLHEILENITPAIGKTYRALQVWQDYQRTKKIVLTRREMAILIEHITEIVDRIDDETDNPIIEQAIQRIRENLTSVEKEL